LTKVPLVKTITAWASHRVRSAPERGNPLRLQRVRPSLRSGRARLARRDRPHGHRGGRARLLLPGLPARGL